MKVVGTKYRPSRKAVDFWLYVVGMSSYRMISRFLVWVSQKHPDTRVLSKIFKMLLRKLDSKVSAMNPNLTTNLPILYQLI